MGVSRADVEHGAVATDMELKLGSGLGSADGSDAPLIDA